MNIAVPSRFACLKIEDEDGRSPSSANVKNVKKNAEARSNKNNDNKKLAIKQNSVSNKKQKQKQQLTSKQWEEWKKRDDEVVNDSFEQDLQSAIIQSKLDYDKKKDVNKAVTDNNKKVSQASKKKKNKTMSLDQFLGVKVEKDENGFVDEEKEKLDIEDEKLFQQMIEVAKKEVSRGKIEEQRRKREANIDGVITAAQFQQRLEKEKATNRALSSELGALKEEMADVKTRNKTLCAILGHGEMKDKADVLLEVERLASVKNELTEEVSRLHTLLEQERSKVAALLAEKHKDNKKHKKNGL